MYMLCQVPGLFGAQHLVETCSSNLTRLDRITEKPGLKKGFMGVGLESSPEKL